MRRKSDDDCEDRVSALEDEIRPCAIQGCHRPLKARGICGTHYWRMARDGTLPPAISRHERTKIMRRTRWGDLDVSARLEEKVIKSDGCWGWSGATDTAGYGQVREGGRNISAHRLAWVLTYGPIPAGLYVLHHCDNPPCTKTEPDAKWPEGHLFLGTAKDNAQDRDQKGRMGPRTGMNAHHLKYTTEQIATFRQAVRSGSQINLLATEMGINQSYAYHLVRELWVRPDAP